MLQYSTYLKNTLAYFNNISDEEIFIALAPDGGRFGSEQDICET
jgi:hypothetical protein